MSGFSSAGGFPTTPNRSVSRLPSWLNRTNIFIGLGSLILCALLFGLGFETSYTAPLAKPQHPISHITTVASNHNKGGLGSGTGVLRKSRVAICVVLIDGHIKSHKAYGTNDVKNAIDAEAFVDSVMSADLDFIAIVIDSPQMNNHHHKLELLGWKVVKGVIPVRYDSIAEGFYKENLNISGCCGMDELLKLNVFGMTEYDRVAVIDGDVLVSAPLDEIWAAPKFLKLIYTRGQMFGEPFQGGLWAITPDVGILQHMVSLVQRGAWYSGTGWEHSGVGWVYGGPTIQGLMPYYFTKVAPINASMALSVCHYNNMGNTERCGDTPVEHIRSFHFTGACDKPFRCHQPGGVSCKLYTDMWWSHSRAIEKQLGFPERPRCPGGHYIPLGDANAIAGFTKALGL